MRLGDFSAVCNTVNSMTAKSAKTSPWLAKLKAQGYKCSITKEMIWAAAHNSRNNSILVISDQPQEIKQLMTDVQATVITSAEILDRTKVLAEGLPADTIELLSSIVEQHVCAHADELWISAYSTFSKSIKTIRGDVGHGIHYW